MTDGTWAAEWGRVLYMVSLWRFVLLRIRDTFARYTVKHNTSDTFVHFLKSKDLTK
jgi:hypothetical protein